MWPLRAAETTMTKFSLAGALVALILLIVPVAADDAKPPADPSPIEWQAPIAGQILAFRNHDAPGALSFAAASFHKTYADPTDFFIAIIASGYAPIMNSTSQTFGPYKLIAPDQVLQEVKLTGTDQAIYEAIYVLSMEADGWRVSGVQLTKTQAVGV
jgi:hypothetical protein